MPDNPIAGLYPQPPQPQQNALSQTNPLTLLPLMMEMQRFGAEKAAGQAALAGIGPDGQYNPAANLAALRNMPNAAMAAPAAIGSAVSSGTGAYNLSNSQTQQLYSMIGSGANDPTMTPQRMRSAMVSYATSNNLPSSVYTGLLSEMPQDTKSFRRWAGNYANISSGAPAANERIPFTLPSGQVINVPKAAANVASGAGGIPGAIPGSLPPGQTEQYTANRAAYTADQQKSAMMGDALRPLQNALPLIAGLSHGDFGETSQQFATLKGILESNGFIAPNSTNLEVRQEANKYLNRYVSGSRGAGRSDEGLHQALVSNPNLDLTQGANFDLARNQIAMDRMDIAKPQIFALENQNTPGGLEAAKAKYNDFNSSYYQKYDQRAFEFDMMSPKERGQLAKSLGPKTDSSGNLTPQWRKFLNSYQAAQKIGAISPPSQPQPQPQSGQ